MKNIEGIVWEKLKPHLKNDSMENWVKELFSDCFSYSIPSFWDSIVADLVYIMYKRQQELTSVKVVQVKIKFGGLRFYTSGQDDFVNGAIYLAESQCLKICTNCGSYGQTKLNTGRWNAGCVLCADTSFEMT